MKKLLNKKGFTLMEMLIVVAIIIILVAISIPAFSNSLDSAKKATDAANFRSARAAFVSQTLAGASDAITPGSGTYYYDFNEGKFVSGSSAPAHSQGECSKHAGKYITIYDAGSASAHDYKVGWNVSTARESCD